HTRFSRDWSSDVCSSDLPAAAVLGTSSGDAPAADVRPDDDRTDAVGITSSSIVEELQLVRAQAVSQAAELAEAKAAEEAEQARVDRKSVVEGKREDLGGC